ncbi:hypothetical protein [Cyanothece sp. BG0011]|uniref:hypothetical protein n=1 Tax=Cyanothece sp. BG0011 TaxID=2082950 RepID=UPI000D1E9401|nr:hypothetical protein [Cyanothece sp. BG0011]
MTELLEKVITELKKLPPDQQDAIASRLMEELKDEQQWTEKFESTTDEQWDQIAGMVRQETSNGETTPLDNVFRVNS